MSRLANTVRNAKVGLLFHVLFLTAQFVSRKIFLDGLGDEFMGVTSTLYSFLNFLNLAELGIGTAIGFTLYKPIFDDDREEINKVISYFGSIYQKVGLFILGASILVSFSFPWVFDSVDIPLGIVYFAFFGFLSSSLLGYFFNYHVFLLQADQKEYVISKYFQSINISKIILQAVFVFYLESYILWIFLELLTGLLYTIVIRKKIKRVYPWLNLSFKTSKSDRQFRAYKMLLKKIKQISIHKIGEFFAIGLDNILIFFFLNAQTVAFFANYQIVLRNLGTLVEKVFAGSKASVGNLVAENKPETIKQVFWEMMALRFFIGIFGAICIFYQINPFIKLWLGEKYVLTEEVVIFFSLIFWLRQTVQPTEVFKQAYGLYDDVWAPIVKSIINLTLSLLLIQSFGILGLLIGTFTSVYTIEGAWRPYYVYRHGFQRTLKEYYLGMGKLYLIFILGIVILNKIFSLLLAETANFFEWSLQTLITAALTFIVFSLLFWFTDRYSRDLVKRIYSTLRK